MSLLEHLDGDSDRLPGGRADDEAAAGRHGLDDTALQKGQFTGSVSTDYHLDHDICPVALYHVHCARYIPGRSAGELSHLGEWYSEPGPSPPGGTLHYSTVQYSTV